MSRDQKLSPEEIVDSFKKEFAKKVTDTKVERHPIGPKKNEMIHIWMTVDRSSYRDVVKHLMTLDEQAHFAVSSGYDIKDRIEIINHFSIYFGERGEEISINFKVALPKSDPTMESICDLIPGALISEQEKQEMLGIKVKNIPKDMRVFISDDFPEDMYPWRKDEMNADKMGRNLHEHDKIPAANVDKVEDDE
jgi:membrane-bound hydrogenase subunit beta